MAELLHEIWKMEEGAFSCDRVCKKSDEFRTAFYPNALLIYRFTAKSDHEAFQKNHDWHGFGRWKPVEGYPECFFTEKEAEKQRQYLAVRNID